MFNRNNFSKRKVNDSTPTSSFWVINTNIIIEEKLKSEEKGDVKNISVIASRQQSLINRLVKEDSQKRWG
jgi:hypothetical protein